jgi:hypothetical protein
VLPPRQQVMLMRGTIDKEHAMAEAHRIAFVGIDIGKLVPRRRSRWARRHRAAAEVVT